MLGTAPESEEQLLVMGWRDCPMDIVERCFLVAGMTCFFVLVGMGVLTLSH